MYFYTHRVNFYTQCIRLQNVLFLHPSSDLLHYVFYTHRVYSVRSFTHMKCIHTHRRRLQKHTPLCKITVCIITHVYKIIHCVALHTLCNITLCLKSYSKMVNLLRYIWKNLHLPKNFTRAPPVAPVTNIRYDIHGSFD